MTVNFHTKVKAKQGRNPNNNEENPQMFTIHEIARLMGVSGQRAQRRVRSFLRFSNIPRDHVIKRVGNTYAYVLDERLVNELLEFYQPKIRIEVRVE